MIKTVLRTRTMPQLPQLYFQSNHSHHNQPILFGMSHPNKSPTHQIALTWPIIRLPENQPVFATTKENHASKPNVASHTYADCASSRASDSTTPHFNAQTQHQPFSGPDIDWPFNPLPVNISTPVNIPYFESLLQDHPNPWMVQYLVNGLNYGFDIGTTQIPNLSRPKNH